MVWGKSFEFHQTSFSFLYVVFFLKARLLNLNLTTENTLAGLQIQSYFLLHGNNFEKELTVNIVIKNLFWKLFES